MTDLVPRGDPQYTKYLKLLGFDPNNDAHRLAIEMARHYGLDPLRKELIIIPGKGAYITRDGYLTIAHRSGLLDGIEVESEWEDDTHWCAVVVVYRKDATHGFRFKGRYPHQGGNKQYGPEMAVKTAVATALKHAFSVVGLDSVDQQWDKASSEDIETIGQELDTDDPLAVPDRFLEQDTEDDY